MFNTLDITWTEYPPSERSRAKKVLRKTAFVAAVVAVATAAAIHVASKMETEPYED
jgi:hypothetical protein